ncbi:DUF3618 domain-containing protein [Paramicrobacterium agarici]|uniref:Uncharacterized protein DUF3618 n=1 Tax=Paramicrobacterium agarici TaxID=630514 RepID=A0A2A9DV47_9MICO|nr:DUF3618 domain-containing protein [Microbacterium agarici]PFG30246.1 uncharacterized protein DUF3618 [Microbacterium agarici]
MTTDDPNAIRSNIEATRGELGRDVDALADKVSPSKAVHRQTDKMKGAVRRMSDKVMGTASDVGDSVSETASDITDDVSELPHRAAKKAEGNPLAVGLIAFGVGWLASSLIPASSQEKEMGSAIKESAQPLVKEAKDAAKNVAEDLKEPASEAVDNVKQSAEEAAQEVKSEASSAASDVKDDATEAKHAVQDPSQSQG